MDNNFQSQPQAKPASKKTAAISPPATTSPVTEVNPLDIQSKSTGQNLA